MDYGFDDHQTVLNMRALIIDETAKMRVSAVIAYAYRNVVTAAEGQKTIQTGNAVGNDPGG